MARERLRVAILSVSPAWREGIAALLHDADEIESIASVTTTAELGGIALAPDVVIVDAPYTESIETLVKNHASAMPLVILSDSPERLGLLAGGVAILERNAGRAHVLAALQAAASGLIALSPSHAERLLQPSVEPALRETAHLFQPPVEAALRETAHLFQPPVETALRETAQWIQPLTARERQILRMLADGMPNKSIALDLQISEHTAKFHVSQILAKLGAESRTEAVAIGIRQGLVMI
jgi:DNA-binding NarL/FixJ family response regulator